MIVEASINAAMHNGAFSEDISPNYLTNSTNSMDITFWMPIVLPSATPMHSSIIHASHFNARLEASSYLRFPWLLGPVFAPLRCPWIHQWPILRPLRLPQTDTSRWSPIWASCQSSGSYDHIHSPSYGLLLMNWLRILIMWLVTITDLGLHKQ